MKKYFVPILFAVLISTVLLPSMQAFAGGGSQVCDDQPKSLVFLIQNSPEACIIAGDKIFDNWEQVSSPNMYDIINVIVSPVTDDPNNPGLRFVTNNLAVVPGEVEGFTIGYDVSTLSGAPLIKDYSLELIEFTSDVLGVYPFVGEAMIPV